MVPSSKKNGRGLNSGDLIIVLTLLASTVVPAFYVMSSSPQFSETEKKYHYARFSDEEIEAQRH